MSNMLHQVFDTGVSVQELRALYRAAESRAARLRLLVEMGRDLGSIRTLDMLLQVALERVTAFSAHDDGTILLRASADAPLRVGASLGADAIALGTEHAHAAHTLVGQALAMQRAVVLHGQAAASDPFCRLYRLPVASVVCLPLIAPDADELGVLVLKSSTPLPPLDNDDLEALQLLASQLGVAVINAQLNADNAHLVASLVEREQRLADLVARLLVAQEDERRRIAYELHDGLAQVAASTHQHLQTLAYHYRPRAPRARQELDQALALAQQTIREARTVIAGLRPTILDDFGLATALRQHIDALCAQGWQAGLVETLGAVRLAPLLESALFRVAQEALNNVRKHAHTTRVELRLEAHDNMVHMTIQDWGRGFDVAQTPRHAGPGEQIGLLSMRERIALLGGRCTITSQPAQGTLVSVAVPVEVSDNREGSA